MPQPKSISSPRPGLRLLAFILGAAALGGLGLWGLKSILPTGSASFAGMGSARPDAEVPGGTGQGTSEATASPGSSSAGSPSAANADRALASGAPALIGSAQPSTAESIAKDPLQLLAINQLATVTSDEQFRRLVDDANMAATKGGDEQERLDIARLIESGNYSAAASGLMAIAERPGGVTTFTETDLPKVLRKQGRTQEAEALEAELGARTLATLERMEELALGQAAPVVFDITFWRANQYLRRGTPEWRRAFECLERVGASIPPESTARNAGYVRSLGVWARQTIDRFDAELRQPR